MELSFTGPRRGVASWLAAPGVMGSLDFVSPKTTFALAVLLKSPAKIFDDVKDLATASNPNAFASLSQAEEQMNLSLRDDFLSRLTGEVTLELDRLTPSDQEWKVLLKTNDSQGLLATLNRLFVSLRVTPAQSEEDGVTYYTILVPSPQKPLGIGYAIVDNYLIVGSSRNAVAEGIRLHRSGESLAKSSKLQTALPPGSPAETSALFYEDPIAMAALSLRQMSPELADSLSKSTADTPPAVIAAYGDETALREASRSGGADFGAAMVVAAVAIPNLMRARMAANESTAVASIRTANTAQIAYQTTYRQKGYARDLASLGPDPRGPNFVSSQHASLIDSTLGDVSCISGAWCIKSGYRFSLAAHCRQRCAEYVVVATPVSSSTGTRNFCSTSDAIVRVRTAPPLGSPITAAECHSWTPLN